MFTELRLKNFKSYKQRTSIPLAPLTVLIGVNNAGKSSILQAILLLKQTMEDRSSRAALVTAGQYIDLGGYFEIVHGGPTRKKESVEIGLSITPVKAKMSSQNDNREFDLSSSLDVSFAFNEKSNDIFVEKSVLSDSKGSVAELSQSGKWSSRLVPEKDARRIQLEFMNFLPSFRPRPTSPKIKFTEKLIESLMFLDVQGFVWNNMFMSVNHIAPLRSRVPWYSSSSRRSSSDLGPGGENLLRVLSATEKIRGDKTLCERVNRWIDARFKVMKNLKIERYGTSGQVFSLFADEIDGHSSINVAAMGEGMSQVLPIIARSLLAARESVLFVEQPELHLHPSAQSDLADIFIDRAKNGRQVIVETHSEHILLRIRRRIAEGGDLGIDPEKVAILFVEQEHGESTARRLKLNGNGHFDDWPDGFFDEAYREAMALAMAQPVKD